MNATLILTHGLPASGKSTWARQQADLDSNVVIVNRDDIRAELYGNRHVGAGNYPSKNEGNVTRHQNDRLKAGFREGRTVILDGVNLNKRALTQVVRLAQDYGVDIAHKYFDTLPVECKKRNAQRQHPVPDSVIDKAWEDARNHAGTALRRFVIGANGNVSYARDLTSPDEVMLAEFNASLPRQTGDLSGFAVIFDMDGTLVDTRNVSDQWMGSNQRNFHRFHIESLNSPANEDVLAIAHQAHDLGLSVVVVTARMADYARVTINWLKNNGVPVNRLYMRATGDYRPDFEVKSDIVSQINEDGFTIVHAVDDNPKVLALWNERSILTTTVPFHTPADLLPGQEPIRYEKQVVYSPFGTGFCIRCGDVLTDGEDVMDVDCLTP